METFRLNSIGGGLLSLGLGFLPDVATISNWADFALKLTSLASVCLILILNIKKLRSNAPA